MPGQQTDQLSSELFGILREFTPKARANRIGSNARLLHDLLITGDDFHSLIYRLDEHWKLDLAGFAVDQFIPSELSWDAFLIPIMGRWDIERALTAMYKELSCEDILRLMSGQSWSAIAAEADKKRLAQ